MNARSALKQTLFILHTNINERTRRQVIVFLLSRSWEWISIGVSEKDFIATTLKVFLPQCGEIS